MDLLFQQLFNGLTLGSVYILVGIGLTLVFGILHVPNFAHGSLYLIGGYTTLMVMKGLGVHYFVGISSINHRCCIACCSYGTFSV